MQRNPSESPIYTMTKRRLLNLLRNQKQSLTSILRPRPFSHRLMDGWETENEGNGANSQSVTMETLGNQEREKEVALRTVPIILKNGNRRITVNCLLDKGSDTTYVNEDIVNELGLTGEKEPIEVKVANHPFYVRNIRDRPWKYRRSSRQKDNCKDFHQHFADV